MYIVSRIDSSWLLASARIWLTVADIIKDGGPPARTLLYSLILFDVMHEWMDWSTLRKELFFCRFTAEMR